MSCYNPLLMVKTDFSRVPRKEFLYKAQYFRDHKYGVDTKNQYVYKLVSKESRSLPLEKILEAYSLKDGFSEVLQIPCGQCIGCRLDYSKDWANRCEFESKKYEHNYFITLTYDEEHAVLGDLGNATLVRADLDEFVKKLKDYFRNHCKHLGVKVFCCGEYGDLSWRPHYHLMAFNLPLFDLVESFPSNKDGSFIRKLDSLGVPMKFSPLVSKLWNKGIITIQEGSWNTAAYISKYILKKQTGENSILYKKLGVLPPFLKISKGIGKDYVLNNSDILFKNPCVIVPRLHREPLVSGLPRYYKKILKKLDPDEYESLINEAKVKSIRFNSCLLGHQTINQNRIIKEAKVKSNNIFERNLKEKS